MGRIAGRFGRVEPRRRARQLVLGLLADLPRKNCWTIAEHAGDATPHGLQHLLARAKWDADAVRDDLRAYVVDHLADDQAVLVVDETGDLKKGTRTVGVQRQYTGTAGRIENSQVAVYLTYTSRHGHAAIDRAPYLPKSWTSDPERLWQAGVPDGTGFATKPQLAQRMIEHALAAGTPAAWAAADEVYGNNPALRSALEARGLGYVLAVSCSHPIPTAAGPRRADLLAKKIPRRARQKLSAGRGAKGYRFLRLGTGRHHRTRPGRPSPPANPPQPNHERTGLPLLVTPPGAAGHPGTGRRQPLDGGRDVPEFEGAGGTGRAPSAALGLLAPLGHPGPAGSRLPRRHRRPRTPSPRLRRRRHQPQRPDPSHLQRDPAPVRRAPRTPRPRHRPPTALVNLAPTPPSPSTPQPLPPPGSPSTMKITIYISSTRTSAPRRGPPARLPRRAREARSGGSGRSGRPCPAR